MCISQNLPLIFLSIITTPRTISIQMRTHGSINHNVGQPRYFRLSASPMAEEQDQKYIGAPTLFPLRLYLSFCKSLLVDIHMIQNMLTVKIVPFKVLHTAVVVTSD